jgi:(p)ppGpp synthase/HD superfamily hydrolase
MKFSPTIQKALNIAAVQHKDQTRKVFNYPYITHLVSVAWILSEWTDDEDVLVAGLLHDVLEDTEGYGYDNIAADFGTKVASIVAEVSEDKVLAWRERKEAYLAVIEKGSDEAVLVCAADKIHNIESLLEVCRLGDAAAWRELKIDTPDKAIWFYGRSLEIIEHRLGAHPAVERLRAIYESLLKLRKEKTSA